MPAAAAQLLADAVIVSSEVQCSAAQPNHVALPSARYRREFQLEYNTLQPVLEVWRQGTDSGWDMTAVLARHRWLLGRLADR